MKKITVLCVWAVLAVLVADAAVPTAMDMALLKDVTQDPAKNEAISPFLLSNVLSQVWLGARGKTRNEIGSVLGLRGSAQLGGYTSAKRALSRPSSVTTALFNRIYIRQKVSVKTSFLRMIRSIFQTDVRRFSSVPAAVNAINTDVARVTRNKINNLVDEASLSQAVLVLVGALYFKGTWEKTFTTVKSPVPFFTPQGNIQVPMMKLTKRLPYGRFRDFDVVSIPYDNTDYSLLIIRPLQRTLLSMNTLYRQVHSLKITSIYQKIRSQKVTVTMPKFKIEADYKLKKNLFQLGMRRMFSPAADFSGIAGGLMVSQVIHKVFMEVNEQGTEAAAAVAVVFRRTAFLPPVDFLVDRPFLAVLYHNRQQLNLFSAWLGNPLLT